jgi:hypothetical protein
MIFAGIKMLVSEWIYISLWGALSMIAVILTGTILWANYFAKHKNEQGEKPSSYSEKFKGNYSQALLEKVVN